MSGRFFLDTNIFVYAFDTSAPLKAAKSEELIGAALTSQMGFVSYQVVQEFFNVALRRFNPPIAMAEAERFLNEIFIPLVAVHSSSALVVEALHLRAEYRLSWYDSLIVCAAMQARCETLFTEDLQNGQRFGDLMIVNPFLN